jgi:hypothetical protein
MLQDGLTPLPKRTGLVPLYPKPERCQENDCKGDRKSPEYPELARYLEPGAVRAHAEGGRHGEDSLERQ